jgi:3-oxocholest-4-en-26-oyl-CoA dehydrogenase beta subunit
MDLSFNEGQQALHSLTAQILAGEVTTDRLKQAERSTDWYDRALWTELARAGVAGAGIPDEYGGSGGGIVEICIALCEIGRTVAPVPAWPSMVAALGVAHFGSAEHRTRWLPGAAAGETVLTLALPDTSDASARGSALDGVASFVPAAGLASRIIVGAGSALFLVDPALARLERLTATSGEPRFNVTLEEAEAELLIDDAGAAAWLAECATTALCAVQLGIAERALRLTAEYTSQREQFGRPLGSFQAVQQRAADAYIDVEAMRWTMWQAAWRLDEGLPAAEEVAIAASWAADGGQRVLAAAQHLHGGTGVDLEYPLHRFTLAGKLIELTLGGGARQFARLGALMAQ